MAKNYNNTRKEDEEVIEEGRGICSAALFPVRALRPQPLVTKYMETGRGIYTAGRHYFQFELSAPPPPRD
jgi:hypothetical protein